MSTPSRLPRPRQHLRSSPSDLPLETIDEDTGDTESSLEGWDAVRPDDLSGQLDSMLAEAGPDTLEEIPIPELEPLE